MNRIFVRRDVSVKPTMGKKKEEWSGRIGFILSTIGSAIGLGSIWKFPYEVGSNGGGAFVFCYVMGLLLVVFPLMLVEFTIGRRGRSDAVRSIALVAGESGSSQRWRLLGTVGVVTSFLILSFYSVIGGWALSYAVDTVQHGLPGDSALAVQARFDSLLASPWRMTSYHAVFMALTAIIVSRGISGGIESACKVLMPILIILVVVLALYSMNEGDVYAAMRFLFGVNWELISAKVALEALGLGFFSIGVGLAVMITYASYAGPDIDLRQVAIATIIGDTAVSCLAGLAVFPIVFAEKLDPASGPGLMFVTLPVAFARLPFGTLAAIAFFVLLVVAGLASAISLLEMPVASLQQRIGCSRRFATMLSAAACWALGLFSLLSFNVWADWFPLASIPGFARASVFDLLDQLTSNMLLPAGGIGLAVFGGWAIPTSLFTEELRLGPTAITVIRALLRYVVPCGIVAASLAPLRF
jgi:NSS family neurotransmitter:Na+ symporter